MSEGLSLGVNHQMLVDEYSPRAVDDSQALDDITERLTKDSPELSEGNEALVMIAAHAPEAIPTDLELETLLFRVREAVLGYLGQHSGEAKLEVSGLDEPLTDIGLEDYKQVLLAVKDRVIKAIRWLAKQFVAAYKRLSDRLGRLSVRLMMIERKLDSSSDSAIPTDVIKLPPSAAMLSLLGKIPANASEVMNAVNKVKWLFTTVHNDFNLYQNTFKRAMESGNRTEVLELVRDYLGHLANRLNAKADSQRNGRLVFNQLPNSYIVEISQGDSFTDCWATINRTGILNVGGEESRRPDRASLSRLVSEQRNFLKVVNELYGKVGSRLTTDFRNLVRDAERSLDRSNTDNRTVESTINWFTEQQNRLFYRSMVMACSTMSAAMDYCVVSLRADGVGVEDLADDESFVGEGAASHVAQLGQYFDQRQATLDRALVGITTLSAAVESLAESGTPDHSVSQLLRADLQPALARYDGLLNHQRYLYPGELPDCSESLMQMMNAVQRELNLFSTTSMKEFRLLFRVRTEEDKPTSPLLKKHGYLGESGYVQYLRYGSETPTNCEGVMEGARYGVRTLIDILADFRARTDTVVGALGDTDILVTEVYDAVGAQSRTALQDVTLTGGVELKALVSNSAFGSVSTARLSLSTDAIAPYSVPAPDAEAREKIQELLVVLVELDVALTDHWQAINRIVQHTRTIQGILLDSMAQCNRSQVEGWLKHGLAYLGLLLTEARWQSNLLRDLMLYREAMILSLCFYQNTGVDE